LGISCELFQRWPAMRSCDDEAGPRRPRTHIKVVLLAAAAILSAPKGDSTFVTSAALVNRVGVRAERVPSRSMQAISGEDPVEPDFDDDDDDDDDDDGDDEEAGDGEWAPEEDQAQLATVDSTQPGDGHLAAGSPTKADVARQRLWNMPKDVAPLLEVSAVTYKNKEKLDRTRNLVVMKAKNAKAMLAKSEKIIKQGTLSKIRMRRLMRYGRGEFGRDNALQFNRGGRRAFRMRSGMQDLRYANDKERSQRRKNDPRPLDWKNKRKREGGPHKKRWIGSSFRYGRGTTIARR